MWNEAHCFHTLDHGIRTICYGLNSQTFEFESALQAHLQYEQKCCDTDFLTNPTICTVIVHSSCVAQ